MPKSWLIVATACALFGSSLMAYGKPETELRNSLNAPPTKGYTGYKSGEIIVELAPELTRRSLEKIARKYQLTITDQIACSSYYLVEHPELVKQSDKNLESTQNLLEALLKNRAIKRAEINQLGSISSTLTNDTYFPEQWGFFNPGRYNNALMDFDIDVQAAWTSGIDTSDVVVAVVDMGVDIEHPDLQANIWVNEDEIPGNGIDDDGNCFIDDTHGWDFIDNKPYYDANGEAQFEAEFHGTLVAGIISAIRDNELGVSGLSQAKIAALRAIPLNLSGEPQVDLFRIFAALLYIAKEDFPISNHSYGFPNYSIFLDIAFAYLSDIDHLPVVAAGNGESDIDTQDQFPATFPHENILVVGGTDRDGGHYERSNFGSENVDIAAPAVGILSTFPQADYTHHTGTSFATPMVAGAAAYLYADGMVSGAEIKQRLMDTARPHPWWETRSVSGGQLDLGLALENEVYELHITTVEPSEVLTQQENVVVHYYSSHKAYIRREVQTVAGDVIYSDPVFVEAGMNTWEWFAFLPEDVYRMTLIAETDLNNTGTTTETQAWNTVRLTEKALNRDSFGTLSDFDGDGITDKALFYPDDQIWAIRSSSTNVVEDIQFGQAGDIPVPSDWNGDGSSNIAVFRRPGNPLQQASWFLRNPNDGSENFLAYFGHPKSTPVPGDYNGDGITEVAVYLKNSGQWLSQTGSLGVLGGTENDVPVPADWDGDNATDPAIYRKSTGEWLMLKFNEASGEWETVHLATFGGPEWLAMPGDFDGDGDADPGIWENHDPKPGSQPFDFSFSRLWALPQKMASEENLQHPWVIKRRRSFPSWGGTITVQHLHAMGDIDGDRRDDLIVLHNFGLGDNWFISERQFTDVPFVYDSTFGGPIPTDFTNFFATTGISLAVPAAVRLLDVDN